MLVATVLENIVGQDEIPILEGVVGQDEIPVLEDMVGQDAWSHRP